MRSRVMLGLAAALLILGLHVAFPQDAFSFLSNPIQDAWSRMGLGWKRPPASAPRSPVVVVATPTGQLHELGALLVGAAASNTSSAALSAGANPRPTVTMRPSAPTTM
mgnify:CR=1 FL=1